MHIKHILFIENDPVDVILTQMVFRDSAIKNKLSIVGNGIEAMRFIRREGQYGQESQPDLIIADIVSHTDRIDFLMRIKSEEVSKRIPVIVFTSNPSDVDCAYDYNVNCCIRKPLDLEEFTKIVESIEQFWLNIV